MKTKGFFAGFSFFACAILRYKNNKIIKFNEFGIDKTLFRLYNYGRTENFNTGGKKQ